MLLFTVLSCRVGFLRSRIAQELPDRGRIVRTKKVGMRGCVPVSAACAHNRSEILRPSRTCSLHSERNGRENDWLNILVSTACILTRVHVAQKLSFLASNPKEHLGCIFSVRSQVKITYISDTTPMWRICARKSLLESCRSRLSTTV